MPFTQIHSRHNKGSTITDCTKNATRTAKTCPFAWINLPRPWPDLLKYVSDGSYRVQAYMDRFFRNPLLINNSVADYGVLDFEGATFNQVTKVLAVCGGKQVKSSPMVPFRRRSLRACFSPSDELLCFWNTNSVCAELIITEEKRSQGRHLYLFGLNCGYRRLTITNTTTYLLLQKLQYYFQSVLGSTNSTKCYYLLTNVGSFDIGPWKGPLSMYQGRQEPIVVACRRLVNNTFVELKKLDTF